jgi:hypothetical protein
MVIDTHKEFQNGAGNTSHQSQYVSHDYERKIVSNQPPTPARSNITSVQFKSKRPLKLWFYQTPVTERCNLPTPRSQCTFISSPCVEMLPPWNQIKLSRKCSGSHFNRKNHVPVETQSDWKPSAPPPGVNIVPNATPNLRALRLSVVELQNLQKQTE